MIKQIIMAMAWLFCFTAGAQQTGSNKEQVLQALKQSGLLRQEGNTFIYKVSRASDTPQAKLMYGNLFLGTPYQLKFDAPEKPTGTGVKKADPATQQPASPKEMPAQTAAMAQTAANPGCCTRMQVFQYEPGVSVSVSPPLFREYSFTVPDGVNNIKIEAWSAGGNGYSEWIADNDRADNHRVLLNGSGGGGGAYVLAQIAVQPGIELSMRVPGGGSGSPLTINFRENGIGYLNLQSGHNAKDATTPRIFDGAGGRVFTHSGVFASNFFSINGADGEASYNAGGLYQNMVEVAPGTAPGLYQIGSDKFDSFFGKGGDAPRGGAGGAGLKQLRERILDTDRTSFFPAMHGKTPGGGGGAGLDSYRGVSVMSGRGAPGLVIIYY